MNRTTVFIFHPNLLKSKSNMVLSEAAKEVEHVTVRHIDGIYPNKVIDVPAEQSVLEDTDHVVLQFPMYWYSGPAFMKQWLDEVLAYGWAYGVEKSAIAGKKLSLVVTLGGSKNDYHADGKAGYTVEEFLLPIITTARYVGMTYTETVVIDGIFSEEQFGKDMQAYRQMLTSN